MSVAPLVWSERQILVAPDAAEDDRFGGVSVNGDTVLAGATGDDDAGTDSGSVYVFVRGFGGWTLQQKLVASDGAAGDRFGIVSLSGDTALVTAIGSGFGSAYVFVRSATSWVEQAKFAASDGAAGDLFGSAISLSGDTALVGAYGDGGAAAYTGSAYVFVRSAAVWSEQAKLAAFDGAQEDYFGSAVSLSGDTAMVGAYATDSGGSGSGSVYVFERNAANWVAQGKLARSDSAPAGDGFGIGVSLSGDTAMVGAWGDDSSANNSGSVYEYVRSAALWAEQARLLPNDGAASDHFGNRVSLDGDTVLVGAYGNDDGGSSSGSAYVFARSAAVWAEQVKLIASNAAADDYFGSSVSVSGGTALVGVPSDDDAGSSSGSAYVFALRLMGGESCAGDDACASQFCVDGVCCESACNGSCEACDFAGLEGVCAPTARGSAPAPGCNGYLCNGAIRECPSDCAGDEDCTATHHCPDALGCVPKKVDGTLCGGNNVCLSGHCVDGVCCAEACAQGCGSCVVAGFEGTCTPLEKGHSGTPSCAPHLCGGSDTSCPTGCSTHGDCTQGGHCDNGICQVDGAQGDACREDDACITGHCIDGLCCLSDTCGAYRCGLAGACQTSCSSSAQCASGYQCSSVGKCVPSDALAASETKAGSCHLASVSESPPVPIRWRGFGPVAMLTFLGLSRRRRRRSA